MVMKYMGLGSLIGLILEPLHTYYWKINNFTDQLNFRDIAGLVFLLFHFAAQPESEKC